MSFEIKGFSQQGSASTRAVREESMSTRARSAQPSTDAPEYAYEGYVEFSATSRASVRAIIVVGTSTSTVCRHSVELINSVGITIFRDFYFKLCCPSAVVQQSGLFWIGAASSAISGQHASWRHPLYCRRTAAKRRHAFLSFRTQTPQN